MKAILEFNLPEDREDFEIYRKAIDMSITLDDLGNEVFRPARKHGYGGLHAQRLNELIEDEKVAEAISLLEELFYEVKNRRDD